MDDLKEYKFNKTILKNKINEVRGIFKLLEKKNNLTIAISAYTRVTQDITLISIIDEMQRVDEELPGYSWESQLLNHHKNLEFSRSVIFLMCDCFVKENINDVFRIKDIEIKELFTTTELIRTDEEAKTHLIETERSCLIKSKTLTEEEVEVELIKYVQSTWFEDAFRNLRSKQMKHMKLKFYVAKFLKEFDLSEYKISDYFLFDKHPANYVRMVQSWAPNSFNFIEPKKPENYGAAFLKYQDSHINIDDYTANSVSLKEWFKKRTCLILMNQLLECNIIERLKMFELNLLYLLQIGWVLEDVDIEQYKPRAIKYKYNETINRSQNEMKEDTLLAQNIINKNKERVRNCVIL